MTEPTQRLDLFKNPDFDRGVSRSTEFLWLLVQAWLFGSWLPGSGWRAKLLRAFGAKVGKGVVIKPHAMVKFPWKLELGDHVWIGERVWIDNLDNVRIDEHSCLSQGAYLCTGSHDWSSETFDLVAKPITIESQCWIGARALVAPGTHMQTGSVATMGSVISGTLEAHCIYKGNPAQNIGSRRSPR